MKIFASLMLSGFVFFNSFSQNIDFTNRTLANQDQNAKLTTDQISPVFLPEIIAHFPEKRSQLSEWFDFQASLSDQVIGEKNIYTLLFPDTVWSNFEDAANPGSYLKSRSRTHSVGSVFCPNSDIMESHGFFNLKKLQPYRLDSIAILYNYNRYTPGNIADTLVVNVFKPQKALYYTNSGDPRGCSVGYDLANNKGKNFSYEIKIPLTNADTISYKPRGKGTLFIPLTAFDITPSSYGTPVIVTWSFKPSFTYTIEDTLNGDFNANVPHSNLNHFYFWNYTDYTELEVAEWNNGIFIFSWTNNPRYKDETSNGFVYWRGSSFMGKACYPYANYKITYDPNWGGINESTDLTESKIYPNPASSEVTFSFNNRITEKITIKLYNSIGEEVNILADRIFSAGKNEINFDCSGLKSGIYFLKTIQNDKYTVEKLLIKD